MLNFVPSAYLVLTRPRQENCSSLEQIGYQKDNVNKHFEYNYSSYYNVHGKRAVDINTNCSEALGIRLLHAVSDKWVGTQAGEGGGGDDREWFNNRMTLLNKIINSVIY